MSILARCMAALAVVLVTLTGGFAEPTGPRTPDGVPADRPTGESGDAIRLNGQEEESFQATTAWFRDTATEYLDIGLFRWHGEVFRIGQLAWAVVLFVLILLGVWIGRKILRRTVLRHLRTDEEASKRFLDDLILTVARRTKGAFILLLAAYVAALTLPLSEAARRILDAGAIILLTVQVAIWSSAAFVGMIDKEKRRRLVADPSAAAAFGLMGFFVRVGVWSAAFLLVLTNLGYQIGPLLAGLGVGGIAVAFALQSILGDIFCSIAIVLDKPFALGDFIIVGDFMGSVENIGIKTTRLRSLGGEQIVFSNADLLGSRVRNYKRMFERRVVFPFSVVYETSLDKLERIPGIVRAIIEPMDQVRFDRAHFKEFGDFSLNFEVVYYVLTPDYNVYMDIQQRINLALFKAFDEEDVAFAYPTQEIILRPQSPPEGNASE